MPKCTEYTDEQKKYIQYKKKKDTKLLACAGSGKTRCIIARMNFLVEKEIYKKENLMMLTFSKLTKDDFIRKIKEYGAESLDPECVKTIDSFSKSLIDKDNNIDVSLLSLKFMQFLEKEPIEELLKHQKLREIKSVFVDESQDLNEIQYKIFANMKDKLGVVINLIGDPNQNIYQFRGSSDKYLREFDAKTFKLTKNFRSHKCIIDFSKHLRSYNNMKIRCQKGSNNLKPYMLFYNNEKIIEMRLMEILNQAKENNVDLSDFAILSPTRGRMRGYGKSHGLCLITNILHKNKIKFNQFYEECTDDISGGEIKYQPKKDHVNILTYMGSKGLEWKYVILIDADLCLINKRFMDREKHNHDKFLLYVACSRAIDMMYIFSRYHRGTDYLDFSTNPWFDTVPEDHYYMEDIGKNIKYPEIKPVNFGSKESHVTKLISRMNEYELDNIAEKIKYDNREVCLHKRIYKKDYSKVKSGHAMFLGKYIERMFHCLCDIKYDRRREQISDINNIVSDKLEKCLVTDIPSGVTMWYYKHRDLYNWDTFKADKTIEDKTKKTILAKFHQDIPFNCHTIVQDNYFKFMVLSKKDWIKKYYQKYLSCTDKKKLRRYVFYITVVLHSFGTQHYFHIQQKGSKFTYLMDQYSELMDEMEKFVDEMSYKFVKHNKCITQHDIFGEVDLIDNKGKIWEIKCVDELTLKNYLQVMMYNIINSDIESKKNHVFRIKFINLLKGEIVHYKLKLKKKDIDEIICLFVKLGDLMDNSKKETKETIIELNKDIIHINLN